MELSKQKLELDEAERALAGKQSEIEYQRKVLKRGIEALDKGEDMIKGEGMLSLEVRKIMQKLYEDDRINR